ncbi:MAG: UDP-N-acetylglucosamine 2-epimerase (hydrolyzing) [Dechloromonas sp.]|nr:MAG: UDP-N-acetylglucosamine 2-epimerase (hydrolyzing) [Dechloromonas sp.]
MSSGSGKPTCADTRKICVVTGSRADYGLLSWLLHELRRRDEFQLQLVATGMHLSLQFGATVEQIERDGFAVDARVEMLLASDSAAAISKSVALGIAGFADTLDRLRPDLLLVLGDRFEIFAAVQAAMFASIPIAHIHGGELTEGAVDDAIRHAISKMAHLHFVAAEPYRRRVIQLGEQPECVFNVGALGVEAIRRSSLLSRDELSRSIGFDLAPPYLLVTYHPETLGSLAPETAAKELLNALDAFPGHRIVFTGVNADAGGQSIDGLIRGYVARNQGRAALWQSLGQQRYLSAVSHAEAVVGNSSSGLIEVPALAVPTVNIGTRQGGRVRASTVIDVMDSRSAIIGGIHRALSAEFRQACREAVIPFDGGDTAARIADVLAATDFQPLVRKCFFDLGHHDGVL